MMHSAQQQQLGSSTEQAHQMARSTPDPRARSGLPSLLTNKLEHDQTGKGASASVSVSEDGKLLHPDSDGAGFMQHYSQLDDEQDHVPGMVEHFDDPHNHHHPHHHRRHRQLHESRHQRPPCDEAFKGGQGLQERRAAHCRHLVGLSGMEEGPIDGATKRVARPPPGLELMTDADFCDPYHSSPNQQSHHQFQNPQCYSPPPPPPGLLHRQHEHEQHLHQAHLQQQQHFPSQFAHTGSPPPGLQHSPCTSPAPNPAPNCPPKLGGSSLAFLSTAPLASMPSSPSPPLPPSGLPPLLSSSSSLTLSPSASPSPSTPMCLGFGGNNASGLGTSPPPLHTAHPHPHPHSPAALLLGQPPHSPLGSVQSADPALGLLATPAPTLSPAHGFDCGGTGHLAPPSSPPNMPPHLAACTDASARGGFGPGHCGFTGPEHYLESPVGVGGRCFRAAPLQPGLVHPGSSQMSTSPSPVNGASNGFSPMSATQPSPQSAGGSLISAGRRPLPADTRTLGLSV